MEFEFNSDKFIKYKLDNGEIIFIEVLTLKEDLIKFCNDKNKNEEALTKKVMVGRYDIKNENEKQDDFDKIKANNEEIQFRLFKKDGSCYLTIDSFPSNSIEIVLLGVDNIRIFD